MEAIEVRGTTIGRGIPKICVPIVGKTKIEILNQAKEIKTADIVEWRGDWYEDISCLACAEEIGKELRSIFPKTPLIFTFRTKEEGGEKEISNESYEQLILHMAKSGCFDIIDIEIFRDERQLKHWINQVHEYHCYVIGSNHDFNKTPDKEAIVKRFKTMETYGVDIAKIAVMPKEKIDVLHLIEAVMEAGSHMKVPIIAMSMGREGGISRFIGEWFGSAVTFGSAGAESAPGQINATVLKELLEDLHEVI